MRTLSANVETLLALDNVSNYFLVSITGNGFAFKDTSASSSITISGLGTFLPSDGLMNVEPPRLSEAVDRETYKLTYIDTLFEKISAFETGLAAATITVYVGFYNTSGGTLGGAAVGEPLLDPADIVIAYSGQVDTHGYTIDPNNGTVIALIEGSSPVAALGMTKAFYTTRASLDQITSGDTSFDYVYTGASRISKVWGKA
jgi:hypothetical protein